MKIMTITDIANEYLGYRYEVVNRSGMFSIVQQVGHATASNIFETRQLALTYASKRFAQSEEKKQKIRGTRRYRWCERILNRANNSLNEGKNFYWSPILEPEVHYKNKDFKFWSKIKNSDISSRLEPVLGYMNDNKLIPQEGHIFEYIDIKDIGTPYTVLEDGDKIFKATLWPDLTVELKSCVIDKVTEDNLFLSGRCFPDKEYNPVVWMQCDFGAFECNYVDGIFGRITENTNSVYTNDRKTALDWINNKKATRLKNFKTTYNLLS